MSGWKVYADTVSTADAVGTTMSQKVDFNKNIILRACRIWIICYGNPNFTSLTMKIYSNDGGSPKKLLHTSTNSPTKAEVITLDNGVKEIYFNFNYPVFDADDSYHFVLQAAGYTYSDASHFSWKKAWPDPVYTTNWTPTSINLLTAPRAIYFIGSELT